MRYRLTDNEWCILETLWDAGPMALGPLLGALRQGAETPLSGWSRTTLHTYLTRMAAKGMICMDDGYPRRYAAVWDRQSCADAQRRALVERVYRGSAGMLVAAFVRDGSLSGAERAQLRRLLDDMEV